ncbi:hypothetical protein HZA42_03440 [Candidatus Peregrinibacteria bacterium]|nr:hypothetical protein [Candidatus Peregrinibacteria bacterium]
MKNLYCAFREVFGKDGRRVFLAGKGEKAERPSPTEPILNEALKGLTVADRGKPDSRRVAETDAGGRKKGKATARPGEKALHGLPDIKAVTVGVGADKVKEAARDAARKLGEQAQAAALHVSNDEAIQAVRGGTAQVAPLAKLDSREGDQLTAETAGLLPQSRGKQGEAAKEAIKSTMATSPDLAAALAKLKGPTLPTEDQGVTALGSRGPAVSGEVIGIGGVGGASAKTEVRLAEGKPEPGKTNPLEGRKDSAAVEARVDARIADQAAQTFEGRADTAYFDKAKAGLKLIAQMNLGLPGKSKKTITTADDGLIFKNLVIAAGGSFDRFKKDYVAANLKTGAQIEKFQRDWAKTNCGREDIYADIARMKSDLHAETRITVGKEKQPDKPLVRLGYEVAQALGLGAKSLTGAEVANIYGITSMPAGGTEFVFNPVTKGISVVGADKATALASFNLPNDTDTQRKKYLAQLTGDVKKAPAAAAPKSEPVKKVEMAVAATPTVQPPVAVSDLVRVEERAAGQEEAKRLAAERAAHQKDRPKLVDHSEVITPEEQARIQRTGSTG